MFLCVEAKFFWEIWELIICFKETLNLSNDEDTEIFENHLNPVMLVFIGKLLLSTLRWVPMCHGSDHFSGVLHNFVLVKLATSSIKVISCVTIWALWAWLG